MPRPRLLASACGIVLLLAVADVAHGQTIRGRVSDAQTGSAVATALVQLVDVSGENRAATAADASGRYELTAPGSGRYRLRVEQLGYEPLDSDPFSVDDAVEVLVRDLRLRPSPIPIPGVEVTTDEVNRRIRQFLGMSPAQLRLRPVRSPAIQDYAGRGANLSDLMSRQNIANLRVLGSRSGPCFQFRGRGCLPVVLDGAPLNRPTNEMLPLEMLNTIVILLPNETVMYPSGAVLLFSTAYMR